ncbi:type II toxin-antitoxin system RelE/ParE family toxin [Paenibacillus sp. LHD-117]|uniref:type II toxin-antitoxin system RelE/ParE family toxin n=1 Tax=Paenibacillus sp. LHD-117 TaxID=3071412 RepID=UPI0027DFAB43|nr:type II toxin-antitoxin system RelE/ParE family toxin [Paenibacillus sp. LHD-117]MDQ6418504.1 type II toxin-antitoxin system RelE/ParE family toxin [Paenibacillus sp. LHD-117]
MQNENKRHAVIVSERAVGMLVDHARFLANVSEEAAQNLIKDFQSASMSLETFPERNPWLIDSALPINKYRKLVFGKRYLIIYQFKNDHVYVDFIIDCRQEYAWLHQT